MKRAKYSCIQFKFRRNLIVINHYHRSLSSGIVQNGFQSLAAPLGLNHLHKWPLGKRNPWDSTPEDLAHPDSYFCPTPRTHPGWFLYHWRNRLIDKLYCLLKIHLTLHSDDGQYLGVGTASGSIAVHIAWNLAVSVVKITPRTHK